MADSNFTDEPLHESSDRYRTCKNARNYDCKHKNFMAKDKRTVFCTVKCSNIYHNIKKKKLRVAN